MPFVNAGPSQQVTVNTQPPTSNHAKIETISVNLGTIAGILTVTSTETTFLGLLSGIQPNDVIVGVTKPTTQAGLGIVGFRVDPLVSDKFYITYINTTVATVTPTAAETYLITVARPIPGSNPISAVV